MGTIRIYHHGDTDGKASGASVFHLINLDGYEEKKSYCLYNYDMSFDFTGVEKDDIIFLVDYSLSNVNNIKRLAGLCKDLWQGEEHRHVFWLDHHKTSFDHINDYPLNKITSIIDTSMCATVICYLVGIQMYKTNERNVDKLISCINNARVILRQGDSARYIADNDFIKYVDSWDTWKHNMPNSAEFNIGVMSTGYLQDISNPNWLQILTNYDFRKDMIERLIINAKHVKEYLSTVNAQQLVEMGYEFTLDGYNCIMYNGRGNSNTFGDLINKYDICAMFYFNGETYFYSLYSTKVDTSIISKRMGGGGHPGASGFQSKELLFVKGTKFDSIKEIIAK